MRKEYWILLDYVTCIMKMNLHHPATTLLLIMHFQYSISVNVWDRNTWSISFILIHRKTNFTLTLNLFTNTKFHRWYHPTHIQQIKNSKTNVSCREFIFPILFGLGVHRCSPSMKIVAYNHGKSWWWRSRWECLTHIQKDVTSNLGRIKPVWRWLKQVVIASLSGARHFEVRIMDFLDMTLIAEVTWHVRHWHVKKTSTAKSRKCLAYNDTHNKQHRSLKSWRKYKSENGANTDLWIYQRWEQMPRRSKHLLSTGHTRHEPHVQIR
jgi:hypothetical protein